MADREPIIGAGRPSGEMQPASPPPATPHSTHDLLLLAAASDRDPDAILRAAAEAQVARCAECAAVAGELRALATGLAALPSSRPAPRDMRLSAEQAARLGRGRTWRRLLQPFGAGGLPGLRPVAAALTTLGLAGILLTALPFGFGTSGAATLAPFAGAVNGPTGGGASPGGPAQPFASAVGESSSKDLASYPSVYVPGSGGGVDSATDHGSPRDRVNTPTSLATNDTGPRLPPLTIVSLGLVVAGLGLFAILFVARRVA